MYKNILVPVSMDNETKIAPALELAKALAADDAEITLLHVMEQVPNYAQSYLPGDYRANVRKSVLESLNKAAATIGGKGDVVEGHSSQTILGYAEQNGTDCIVIASHRPGMQDFLLGSTAAKVVRHAQCSVHVIR